MGLAGDMRRLAREYASDPVGQYKRHLIKVLDLAASSGVSRSEVVSMVVEWSKARKQEVEKNACVK